jgi:exodeoxyribonuclease V alpha subunit
MSAWSQKLTPTNPAATELLGELARIRISRDNEDGTVWIIGDLTTGEVVSGRADQGELVEGGHYRFLGRWPEPGRYGWQFAWHTVLSDVPVSDTALIAYLARHCDGVGPATAAKLVTAYGRETCHVLINDPQKVETDGLLKFAVAQAAGESLAAVCDPEMREAHLSLFQLTQGYGFYQRALKMALRIWRGRAAEQIRRDPFLLMTHALPGCGFLKCDRLYTALGHSPRRLKRQGLAAWYALASRDGDTWLSLETALTAVRSAIGGTAPREKRAVALMYRAGVVCHRDDPAGKTWIAESGKAQAERIVAQRLVELTSHRHRANWPTIEETGLVGHQAEQIAPVLTAGPVIILTGGPGTGKTYCAAAVIKACIRYIGRDRIAVVAPTGKAAVRIAEKMRDAGLDLTATTVHRLLGVRPNADSDQGYSFGHNQDNPLPHRVIATDEWSMADTNLFAALLLSLSPGTMLLIVGDPHQLPPVGHGAPLRDMIAAGLPCARLTEIRRNAGLIVEACASIKDGRLPELPRKLEAWPEKNLIHLSLSRQAKMHEGQQALEALLSSVYDWLPRQELPEPNPPTWDLVDDVQVICALNRTRQTLNTYLQARLNPQGEPGPLGKYRNRDKVICLRNGFCRSADPCNTDQVYVANGDIGRVVGFAEKTMAVQLRSPDRLVAVPLGKQTDETPPAEDDGTGKPVGSWDLAYAITVHKSQGSEAPVIVFIAEAAGRLGSRELVYTAISRAKELCLIIGDRSDITRSVKNSVLPMRKTFLTQLIRGEMPM